jgi:class 3 adenylate cyclase
MKAWTIDADDIRVAEDFDASLLHRTPEIDDFLSHERDDKFVVTGTKGSGKTLLLKAKRVLYQRDGRALCLPEGNLLDKPIGDKIFSQEVLQLFAASPLWWSKVWLTAIAVALLKRLGRAGDLDVSPRLKGLVTDEHLQGVIDHFVRLLDMNPGDLQRCANDADGHLVPRLRAVNTPVAIFIDGVDEYFNKHIESLGSRASAAGQLSPEVWYYSQLGLVEVAYQLRRVNHHVKVFAAVRKEAYSRLRDSTAMWLQYRGSAVDIVYSAASLREIFVNNVRQESASRLARPDRLKADPVEAFLGATHVAHSYTRESEDAFEYVCRHTLLRPRDLMTIGQRLSTLPPGERQGEQHLKNTVNDAAAEIAHEYLQEIAPYLGGVDLHRIFPMLPGRTLSRDEVEGLFLEHNLEAASGAEQHVFCALYKAGLLGWIHNDRVRGRKIQRFLRPGEGTFEPDGALPMASHYVVHPVLSDIIGRVNPRYLDSHDRANIVGYDRPWREVGNGDGDSEVVELCVLNGDIDEFGDMIRLGADGPVREALERAVRDAATRALYHEVRGGDSVVVVHHDPVELARMARQIIDDVYAAPGQPRLRVALHYGEVRIRRRGDKPALIEGGEALLWAARVEPRVEPGQIWATEQFGEELRKRPSLCRATLIHPSDGGDLFNVRKESSREADMWVRLYRIEF